MQTQVLGFQLFDDNLPFWGKSDPSPGTRLPGRRRPLFHRRHRSLMCGAGLARSWFTSGVKWRTIRSTPSRHYRNRHSGEQSIDSIIIATTISTEKNIITTPWVHRTMPEWDRYSGHKLIPASMQRPRKPMPASMRRPCICRHPCGPLVSKQKGEATNRNKEQGHHFPPIFV